MCNTKTKVCLMRLTMICLSISFALQLVSYVLPSLLHVEIDGTNMSEGNYSVNGSEYYKDEYESYDTMDESENSIFYDLNETWLNATILNETENFANRSFALWFILTCINGQCQVDLYPDLANGSYEVQTYFDPGYNFSCVDSRVPFERQREFQTEVTLALVITFISVILVWDQKKKYLQDIHGLISEKCHLFRHIIVIVLVSLSGCLMWIPCMAYGSVNIQLLEAQGTLRTNDTGCNHVTVGTPFTLIFSCCSNIMAAVACLFIFSVISVRKRENTVRQTDIIALNTVRSRDGQSSHHVPFVSTNEQVPDNAHFREMFLGGRSNANSVHANTQTDNDHHTFEDAPPSYEETMRLYNNTGVSNVYTREETKPT